MGWRAWVIGGTALVAAGAYYWPGSPVPALVAQYTRLGAETKGAADKVANKKQAEMGKGRSGPPPALVTVAEAVSGDMPIILSAPGTAEPLATVAVRPRVEGHIVEVGFKEGDFVEEGQVLFRLDDRLARAQIQQAEANVAKDKASLKDAESILQRREVLLRKNFASEASTETARQSAEVLKASIKALEAQLEWQRTQLDFLLIRAPIAGRTGAQAAKLGTFVRTGDIVPLVTINQTRPIAIAFSIPQAELAALRRALRAGSPAQITIPGAAPVKLPGTISFVDNQVDKQTGTITAKISSANGDEALWPGQAVEVALTVEVRRDVISVPAAAVSPSQAGMMVWVLSTENKASPRTVEIERIVGQTAYLAQGVKAGERVVTDGQLRLAPGASVSVQQPRGKDQPAAGERRGNGRS